MKPPYIKQPISSSFFDQIECFLISNWYTHRFKNQFKETENKSDMGFETREGLKFFFQNIWNKISIKLQL
jgi:hypothetical protein